MKRWILVCLLVMTGLATIPAAGQQADPAIRISPEEASAGDTLAVEGTGFTPGTMVSAFLGVPDTGMRGEPFTSAQVADDGTFALSFTLPDAWPSGAPIVSGETLVVIASDFQPLASASFHYEASLEAFGWQEYYNPTFDFSVLAPPDWTAGSSDDGFGFTPPGSENVGLSVQAVALPQDVDAEAVANLSLEAYIAQAPMLELQMEGITDVALDDVRAVTTASGVDGIAALWSAHGENGVIVNGQTAYFDLNQTVNDHLYRTVQIRATDPSALVFFDAVVSSFTWGHQSSSDCPASEGIPSPTAPAADVMDTQQLIAALCAAGASVRTGEPVPHLAIPIFHAPGMFLAVDGEDVQVYEFPDEAAAQAVRDAVTTVPGGTLIGAPNVEWTTLPHFFGAGRVIALYTGNDPAVYALLESVLGAQVAGGAAPVTP